MPVSRVLSRLRASAPVVAPLAAALVAAGAWVAAPAAEGGGQGQQQQQQQPPPPTNPTDPQQQQPVFRVRIDTISVDVIVTDRDGKPVTDLTADDFEIREGGKTQKIETFKLIDIEDAPAGPPPRDLLSFEDQRRETSRDDNRLLVILLDDYHVRRENAMRIRQDLANFVSQLSPRDLVAVMYPLTPATAVTFSRNHDGTAIELMAFEGRKYDYSPRNAVEARFQMLGPEGQEAIRNETTLTALENVCRYLATLRDGRKSVLFVSEGLSSRLPPGIRTQGTIVSTPMNVSPMGATADLFSQLQDVFREATRANTAIYTLDPRGLASGEFGIQDQMNLEADRDALNEAQDTLRAIAAETDGRSIIGRNSPVQQLLKMRDDTSVYYLMSYTSSIAPRDGKFHEIDVRLKNRRGLNVRARKGYWAYTAEDYERATAVPKPLPPEDVMEALDALASAATPTARKAARLYLGAVRGSEAGKARVTFTWESTRNATTASATDVATAMTITAHSIYGDVLFKGPVPNTATQGPAHGHVTFDAPPGSVRVDAVAENARGVRVDTDSVTVEIPDFASDAITFSTPAIFRGRTARDLQLIRAEAAPIPTASRVFARAERLLVRVQVYAPATPSLAVRMLNNQGDKLTDLPAPARTDDGTFDIEFALGSFPPGDYLLEFTATAGNASERSLFGIRIGG